MNIQSKFLLLSICILLVLPSILLADCDMMALISINPKGIAACDPGAGDYDSPHDYFDFLRSRSGSQDLDIPLNCDGYGVIYYRLGESTLSKEQTFYKTGFHTWYEAIHGEPMNLAEDAIMTPMNRASIVLGHDRLGTGGFGSHPFTFIWNNKTYSFIHNGAISSSAKTAFMNYLGEEWFVEHPSNWHGVYGDIRSFIDSELLFHFIMSMIMESNGNIVLGIQKALNNHDLEGFDFRSEVFHGMNTVNFVLTDGTSLYVFRNSRMDPTLHNLSYNVINNRFIGIKTQEQTGIEIHQNEMIVFDQSGTITSIPMVSTLPVELSSFTGSVLMES
ncbi:MAG TPA: hypothetical protein PKK33_07365 [Candidatus Cloacimonadota bacterium]|nr:hypothetical protein [Candidatus Cloacimonadota bacterium]